MSLVLANFTSNRNLKIRFINLELLTRNYCRKYYSLQKFKFSKKFLRFALRIAKWKRDKV